MSVVTAPFVADLRPASTVIVLRDSPDGPQVFMVRRHEGTAFMGGAHVFPGGRVDPSDANADPTWCDGLDHARRQLAALRSDEAAAYHVAAARELFEEAGVLLARSGDGRAVSLGGEAAHARFKRYRAEVHDHVAPLRDVLGREQLRLALDELVSFAHWVTPPGDTRRFDTRFFVARVPAEQVPAHDETETTQSAWLTPFEALGQARAGRIILPPPTWTTLRELEPFTAVDAALAWARQRRIIRRQPQLVEHDGRRMLVLPGDPLYTDTANGDMPVETRFVFVDRSWRAERAPT